MKVADDLQEALSAQTRDYEDLARLVRKQQAYSAQEAKTSEEDNRLVERIGGELQKTIGEARNVILSDTDWRREALNYEQKYINESERNRACANEVRHLRELEGRRNKKTQDKTLSRARRWNALKQAQCFERQFFDVIGGRDVDKVEGAHIGNAVPTKSRRKLKIVFKPDGPALAWAKTPMLGESNPRNWDYKSFVPLRAVIALGYGFAARAPYAFEDENKQVDEWGAIVVPPSCPHMRRVPSNSPKRQQLRAKEAHREAQRRQRESHKRVDATRCFSVYTKERSYDFICATEDDTESFMFWLTKLCSIVQGWPVPGGIKTHAKFVCAKGWVKVQRAIRNRSERVPLQEGEWRTFRTTLEAAVSHGVKLAAVPVPYSGMYARGYGPARARNLEAFSPDQSPVKRSGNRSASPLRNRSASGLLKRSGCSAPFLS